MIKFKNWFKHLKERITNWFVLDGNIWYKDCYNTYGTKDNICHGVVGGTKATNYLSEMCIDCPYFVMILESGDE